MTCANAHKREPLPPPPLPKFVGISLGIKYCSTLLTLDTLIPKHPAVHPYIITLDRYGRLWCNGVQDEVVVAVGAVFVGFLEFSRIFPEALFALLAGKDHLEFLKQRVVFFLLMAFYAVEPFPAWERVLDQ